MKYVKIHKEGKWIIAFTLLLLFIINIIVYLQYPKSILAANVIVSALLFIFVMFFFRNPSRVVEIDDPSLVVAPQMELSCGGTYQEHEYLAISVFKFRFLCRFLMCTPINSDRWKGADGYITTGITVWFTRPKQVLTTNVDDSDRNVGKCRF